MLYSELHPGDAFYDTLDEYVLMVMSIVIMDPHVDITWLTLSGEPDELWETIESITYGSDTVIRQTVEVWRP